MQEFWNNLINSAADLGKRLLVAILVLIVGRILIKWLLKLITKGKFARKNDKTVVTVLSHFISAGLYIILAITIIGILGINTASIITVLASAGVAIGLALQGALSNIAGGIMILVLRPFRVGDFVDVSGQSGTVSDVGIFYTVLTTPDNKVVTIPNGTIMAENIVNYSAKDARRVDFTICVAYGTDIEKVKAILLEEASRHELVFTDPEPVSRLSNQGDSSLDVMLRVWTENANYWTVHFDLLEAITVRLEKEGIEIPFNQLDVNIKQ